MPAGMRNEHTTTENIKISDLKSSTGLLFSTVTEVAQEKKKTLENKTEKTRDTNLNI